MLSGFGRVFAVVDGSRRVSGQAECHQPATLSRSEIAQAMRALDRPGLQIDRMDTAGREDDETLVPERQELDELLVAEARP